MSKISTTILPDEWQWATRWSIALLVLSLIPYLIAFLLAPEGWQFAGFMVNPYDGHSYMAKMRQGFEGYWLFHLTYTPEPHKGAFIFTFYLALGHIAALTHLPLIGVFHLARLISGFILLQTAFYFIGHVTLHFNERRWAFILLLTASGLGWLGPFFNTTPIDFRVPEAFVHYSIYANPHFPLSIALMLIILQRVVWPSPKNQTFTYFFWTALAALLLALILPFALLTVWAILAIFLIWLYITSRRWPWLQIGLTGAVGFVSAPVIVYDYWVTVTNPIMAGWSAQNITTAPSLLDLFLGYGLVGVLAILGGWYIIQQKEQKVGEWLVLLWVITALTLIYLPFNLQRRLINGLHVPLCILAAIGLRRWFEAQSLKLKARRQIRNTVITIGALGTGLVWSFPLIGLLTQSPTTSETIALFLIREEETVAFDWLRENSSVEDVILASPRVGMFIPGQTGARAFYGHPFETVAAKTKEEMAKDFYRGTIEPDSFPVPVNYIFYGPWERRLGDPENLGNYPLVYGTEQIQIYQVR